MGFGQEMRFGTLQARTLLKSQIISCLYHDTRKFLHVKKACGPECHGIKVESTHASFLSSINDRFANESSSLFLFADIQMFG